MCACVRACKLLNNFAAKIWSVTQCQYGDWIRQCKDCDRIIQCKFTLIVNMVTG